MAGATNLSIDGLRLIAKGHRYKAMIAVGVREDGVVDVVSYGETKADCKVIGDYAQKQFGDHLPIAPFQTWFGWGNGGTPLAVDRMVYRALSPLQQQYIDANTHPDAVAPQDKKGSKVDAAS